jgi:peptidoglycan/xylan/chitin deacetylase (PgdA/CDA1 family)
MKLAFTKTPKLLQWLFHKRIWAFSRSSNSVYITFDDGPIPEITPWVVAELKKYDAKATFFCIGDNIEKHPSIFKQLITEGHVIGNHTQHHINGWNTSKEAYIKEITRCESLISEQNISDAKDSHSPLFKNKERSKIKKIFRPPYGKITAKQAKEILKKGYSIIMWDILSKDYDPKIDKEKCLKNILKNVRAGSIIVFHDSLKAEKKLRYILPKVLEHIQKRGWKCTSIINHETL